MFVRRSTHWDVTASLEGLATALISTRERDCMGALAEHPTGLRSPALALPFIPGSPKLRHVTRRLIALVIAFAMLHLSVARADAVCEMHGHGAPATSHEGMQHDVPAEDASCETPLSPDCCQAVVSCAPVLDLSESRSVANTAIVHMAIAAAVIERPQSRSTAPEPPPPKA